ncbi:hypothetical protein EDC01DRAFT_393897 [Geopyxis carbonaria]|nr:hypothetical protein EDC01DRAFT_393897 [Geopyxis carbonaria]
MATFAPQHHHHIPPSPPAAPTPAAIASRGRRPALIPHHADLSLSLSAASAALSGASYSPARPSKSGGGGGMAELWALPPPAYGLHPEGEEMRRDVFSWVNAPEDVGVAADSVYSPTRAAAAGAGKETAPASPTAAGFEDVERQKRRLEEAGKR